MTRAAAGKVLTNEVITQIKSKMDELEGKEVDQGGVAGRALSGELSDQDLSSVTGGGVTAAWSIEIARG